jgi:hypothetical protein
MTCSTGHATEAEGLLLTIGSQSWIVLDSHSRRRHTNMVSHNDLSDLQAMLKAVQQRFGAVRDKSDEAAEIAAALDALQSTVAVHRIRAEISNSKHPFELRAKRESTA